ncbi:MAG: ring-cleaving dioxygenase [Spartobacteria bacterium]
MKLRGIHHITAIATDPQRNLDFYARVLGLRFVKRTVNFDDPSAYHFYFGDRTGRPGTAITFFPWPGARRGPTLEVRQAKKTERLLVTLGFELIGEEESRRRFSVNERSTSACVDLIARADGEFGVNSAGTVHHIAFRCADEEEQLHWRDQLVDLGFGVTPVIDRQYFHSIYFRESGGILFEIATEAPGFTADEPVEQLGQNLKLPPQYEEQRATIEQSLPKISLDRQLTTMSS